MGERLVVSRVADGMYRVEHDGRNDIVYVTGSRREQWAFWNGQVFHDHGARETASARGAGTRPHAAQALVAPMPATVIKILATPGSAVKKGDTLIILEAMKMELPLRAPSDGTVRAIHCHEGDLVPPDTTLVELE
jgi:biotin carboxyl carrier protein